MNAKCICRVPDPACWTVIRVAGRDRIVRCSVCRQIWHSTGAYTEGLLEDLTSDYQWRQFRRSPDYHKGESPAADGDGADPDSVQETDANDD